MYGLNRTVKCVRYGHVGVLVDAENFDGKGWKPVEWHYTLLNTRLET